MDASKSLVLIFIILYSYGSCYELGKEYRYDYNIVFKTGINSQLKPILNIDTQIRVNVLELANDRSKILKFEIYSVDVEDKQSTDDEAAVLYSKLEEDLKRPFIVNYDPTGRFVSAKLSKRDSLWTANIKKGIIGLFQVDIAYPHLTMERRPMYFNSTDSFYTKLEDGQHGKCETTYTIDRQIPFNKAPLKVSKTRDFNKCSSAIFDHWIYHGPQELYPCKSNPTKKVQKIYNADYVVIERAIKVAKASDLVLHVPFNMDSDFFVVSTSTSLSLQDDPESKNGDSKNEVVDDDGDYEVVNELSFKLPSYENKHKPFTQQVVDLKKANPIFSIKDLGFDVPFNVDHCLGKINELVELTASMPNENDISKIRSSSQFVDLVNSISHLDFEALKELDKKIDDLEDSKRPDRQAVYFSAISAAGTNPTLLLVKYIIATEPAKAKRILRKSYFYEAVFRTKQVSPTILDEFHSICKDPLIDSDQALKRTCYLTFSSFVYQRCMKPFHHYGKYVEPHRDLLCNPQIALKYYELLRGSPAHFGLQNLNVSDTILHLKVAGNFRLKETIEFVAVYLQYKNRPIEVRTTAAFTLVRLAKHHGPYVRPIIMPFLYDKNEDHVVRIAAFSALVASRPPFEQLFQYIRYLIKNVETEDYHLINYAQKTFQNLANTKNPCYKSHSEQMKLASKMFDLLKPRYSKYTNILYSTNYIKDSFNQKYDFGQSFWFKLIPSKTSIIPRIAYASLSFYSGGQGLDNVAIAFERVEDHYSGETSSNQSKSIEIRDRIPNSEYNSGIPRTEELYNDIDKKINHIVKLPNHYYTALNIIVMGNVLDYSESNDDAFALPREMVDSVESAMMFKIPHEFSSLTHNEHGFPVFLDYKSASSMNTIRNALDFGLMAEVTLSIDVKTAIESSKHKTFGIVIPSTLTRFGTGVHKQDTALVHINFNASLNLMSQQLIIEREPHNHDLLYSELKAYKFVETKSSNWPLSYADESKELSLYPEEDHVHFEKKLYQDPVQGLIVKGGYAKILAQDSQRKHRFDRAEWYKFFSENDYSLASLYCSLNPEINPYHLKVSRIAGTKPNSKKFKLKFHGTHVHGEPRISQLNIEYTEADSTPIAKVDIGHTYTADSLNYGLTFKINDFVKNKNVCIRSSLAYPKTDFAKYPLNQPPNAAQIIKIQSNISFDSDCEVNNIKIDGEFSTLSVNDDHGNVAGDPYGRFKKSCESNPKFKPDKIPYCRPYLWMSSKSKSLKLEIIESNVPAYAKKILHKMHDRFVYKNYPHLELDTMKKNEPNRTTVLVNAVYSWPVYVDINVTTEDGTEVYRHLPPRMYHFPTFYDLYNYKYHYGFCPLFKGPHCFLQNTFVKTFDNVTYDMPSINPGCFKVISKDCGKDKYLILASQKADGSIDSLQVFIDTIYLIELKSNKLTVNGQEVNLVEGQQLTLGTILLKYNGVYHEIREKNKGIDIYSDGYGVYVAGSRIYTGAACGLCGNMNSDTRDDLTCPQGCLMSNVTEFANSWSLSSEVCKIPEMSPCKSQEDHSHHGH